ncbi:MAG: PIN domain-containing protein [Caldilineaceae bacterium]
MIYLDTHVVIWLYAGLMGKFNNGVRDLINDHDLYISPIVRLELEYLYEIQRVTAPADLIVDDMSLRIGLRICDRPFNETISRALALTWTRDPFDRLIVAHAAIQDNLLLSKDGDILDNYTHARWS